MAAGHEQTKGRPQSKEKRQSILDAALELFLSEGFDGTSMDRIAQLAGVSKQTVYSHFKDKQTLFRTLTDELKARFFPKDIAINALTMSPREFLLKFATGFLANGDDPIFVGWHRLLIAEAKRNPDLAETYVKDIMAKGEEAMMMYMKMHPKIKAREPEATTRLFLSSLGGYMYANQLLGAEKFRPSNRQHYIEFLVDTILAT